MKTALVIVSYILFAICRFLINPAKDKDMRKWAVEGLSYLTLDAEVKEKLIEDRPAVQALIDVAKVLGKNHVLNILCVTVYSSFLPKRPVILQWCTAWFPLW